MMPKNKAENIQGILRYFSNKKPSPNEKAKVTAIKRKTYSTAKNLQEPGFSDDDELSKQVLLSFVAPSDWSVKRWNHANSFSAANKECARIPSHDSARVSNKQTLFTHAVYVRESTRIRTHRRERKTKLNPNAPQEVGLVQIPPYTSARHSSSSSWGGKLLCLCRR